MSIQKQSRFLWLYPIIVLLMQIVPPMVALVLCIGLVAMSCACAKARSLLLLFGLTAVGHIIWVYFVMLLACARFAVPTAVIVGRLGLLGYIAAFWVWQRKSPPKQNYFRLGHAKAIIRFPLIWSGKQEPIWRFVLIFSVICSVTILILALGGAINPSIFAIGCLFALLNATLEELLWRGFILTQAMELIEKRQALIITALAFGIYHISLGFPLWACLIFAVGGFYMGGSAIVSKGLLTPWIMHVFVNMIFVCAGLIF